MRNVLIRENVYDLWKNEISLQYKKYPSTKLDCYQSWFTTYFISHSYILQIITQASYFYVNWQRILFRSWLSPFLTLTFFGNVNKGWWGEERKGSKIKDTPTFGWGNRRMVATAIMKLLFEKITYPSVHPSYIYV